LTIRESIQETTHALQPLYDPREAAAVAKYYHSFLTGYDNWSLPLHYNDELTEVQERRLWEDLAILMKGCPLQYVTGEADFYGRSFTVTPAVLIPRPETEELVQMAVKAMRMVEHPRIWDIGTGSGCIAVSIAKELPEAEVFATDISAETLAVARENASRHKANVIFAQHDMREVASLPFPERQFDLIVSNPPYIPERDKKEMHRNVTEHEPATALFVPDEDPLWCYRALADIAKKALKRGGRLMVETYHQYHDLLIQEWQKKGLLDITEQDDINGRPRFVVGKI